MKDHFNQTPLVMVSDTDGTLFQVAGESFNHKLFDVLIENKQKGGQSFICSAADGAQTGGIMRLQLRKRGLPEDFFAVDHDDLDPDTQPVIPKSIIADVLQDMGIRHVDRVFEDAQVDYLGDIAYYHKINPASFVLPFPKADPAP